MKIISILICAVLFFLVSSAQAAFDLIPRVIYGIDDRQEIYESNDNLMREISLSTAALIKNYNLEQNDGVFSVTAKSLEKTGVCKSERFSKQLTAATCSGFLIAPDKLVTAGHCVSSNLDCKSHVWVFDYENRDSEAESYTFNNDQIYHCTKVIAHKKDEETLLDYTVLKLDRKVTGRLPLKVRTSGKMSSDALLTVIGHPSGLPKKITVGAEIRNNNSPNYFILNSDTYSKNSGSPVVDQRTGIVEGILTNGDTDYVMTPRGCSISVIRSQDGGSGERATRITALFN
ncbi:MAG: serine protease [Bdellovibrionales bacterium]|nr:serine protease [Bdellovibrionales bacterium]